VPSSVHRIHGRFRVVVLACRFIHGHLRRRDCLTNTGNQARSR
jgi:hypothetical protein